MSLMYIKLRNGEDIIGHVETLNNAYRVTSPISIESDPSMGYFMKNWLHLSAENVVSIPKDEVFVCSAASEKAMHYYEEFIYSLNSDSDETESDYEDMLTSLLESRVSTKH